MGRDDCKILSASYFYPELLNSTELLHDRKIVARDKRKYFDVAKVKNNEDKTLIGDNKQLMDAHYYKLSLKWLFLESKNISVLEFVKNYSNVAIYSYHNLGEILINKLEANKLDNLINCILDPEPEKYNGKYPVCKPYEFGDDVDLIIVTETYRYSEIMTDISMFSNIEIKSIEDIINELLMKYKLQINTKLW